MEIKAAILGIRAAAAFLFFFFAGALFVGNFVLWALFIASFVALVVFWHFMQAARRKDEVLRLKRLEEEIAARALTLKNGEE